MVQVHHCKASVVSRPLQVHGMPDSARTAVATLQSTAMSKSQAQTAIYLQGLSRALKGVSVAIGFNVFVTFKVCLNKIQNFKILC